MGRKGGEKKGAGRGSKGPGRGGQGTSKAAADGPTIKVKSGLLDISQKNAARIRNLLLQVRGHQHAVHQTPMCTSEFHSYI